MKKCLTYTYVYGNIITETKKGSDVVYESQKKYMKNNLVKLGIDVRPEVREKFKKACEDNNTNASKVLKDFVNNYIFESEEKKMEEMIKELKEELLGKEITLLDMDNKCEEILESPTSIYEGDNLNSALDGTLDMGEETENGCICYRTMNENEEVKEIAVDFDILSKNYIEKMNEDSNYQFKILVKVTNIWII